ncbi:MAG: hypothetical protein AAGK97_12595 [Bacteroidota bacterium]
MDKMEIFDLFKKSQHRLEEAPSKAVWDRLEARLEKDHTKRSFKKYQIFSIAACLFGLIAAVGVIQHNYMHRNQAMASLSAENHRYQLEDMILSDAKNYNTVLINNYYQNLDPIIEGNTKKLIPNNSYVPNRKGRSYDRLKPRTIIFDQYSWILGSWVFKSAVKPAKMVSDSMTNIMNVREATPIHAAVEDRNLVLNIGNSEMHLVLNLKKSNKDNLLFEQPFKEAYLLISKVDNNHIILNSSNFETKHMEINDGLTLIYQNVINF